VANETSGTKTSVIQEGNGKQTSEDNDRCYGRKQGFVRVLRYRKGELHFSDLCTKNGFSVQ
jgi:hypothetical protein